MTVFTKRAVDIFAPTDASGAMRSVVNGEAQIWGAEVETAINAAIAAGALVYATKADLDADLAHDANTGAWVVADSTDANNGIYAKSGASGSGSWTRVDDLPAGDDGWSPLMRILSDGVRRVLQIYDWTGGSGSKPQTGYLGATGIVADIAQAADIRGQQGASGDGSGDMVFAADVLDEDDMASDSDTKVPTQQSVKGYADTKLRWVTTRAAAALLALASGQTFVTTAEANVNAIWDVRQTSLLSADEAARAAADTDGVVFYALDGTHTAVRRNWWNGPAPAEWWGAAGDYNPTTKAGTSAHTAINKALAVVDSVRMPAGNVLLSDMVTLDGASRAKKLTAPGRRLTSVYVNSGFNLAADAVIKFTGGESKHTAGHFSVICQDQPDSATLTDYVVYPPIILANTQPRFKLESLRIQEAYVGIDMRGNSGGAVIDDLELCSFYRGIRVDGSLDSVKISRLHFWPFAFSGVTNKRAVYHDSRGIELGRADDFHLNDALLFGCRYSLYTTTGTGGAVFGTLNSVDFDASGGLYMAAGQLFASNCVFTLGDVNSQMIYIGSGALTVASSYFLNSAVSTLGGGIDVLGGTALFSGCYFHGASADNYIIRAANTATCGVSGSYFYRNPTTTFTKQAIIAAGTGVVLNANGNTMNDMTTGASPFLIVGSTTMGGEAGNHYGSGWSNGLTNGTSFRSDRRRAYTPTVTAGSGALTSVTGQTGDWSQVGDTVYFRARATITTNGTGATSLKFTLPKDNAVSAGCPVSAISSSDGKALAAVIGSGTNIITATNVDGTYPGADGKTIIISGSYQAG